MYGKALEILPMKIGKLPKGKEHMKEEICNSLDYFAQIKKDGFWYMFEKDMDGNCFLFSRVISTQTGHLSEKSKNVPRITSWLGNSLPNGTILIGEIYYPQAGYTSKDVSKVMGCDPEKAVLRQSCDYGWLHYYIFDILQYDGKSLLDWGNLDRYGMLYHIFHEHELDCLDLIELAEIYTYPEHDISKMVDDIIDAGGEGMVLKKKYAKYCPNKKPAWNMIKFKCEDDADVICMGFELPTKEYTGKELVKWQYWEAPDGGIFTKSQLESDVDSLIKLGYTPVTKPYTMGWIGAMRIGVYNKDGELIEIGTVSSGLTDEICADIKDNPSEYIGKPLAVRYMQAYEGALRHPVFVRWRDDLNSSDCTWKKIFE